MTTYTNPETISDILSSKIGALIVCKKEILPDKVRAEIAEYEEESKQKVKNE